MKRKFQLTGGILSIIVGSLSALGGLISLAAASTLNSMGVPGSEMLVGVVIISALIILALGITIIILGARFCKDQKSNSLAIALLVLTAIVALFQIIGTTDGNIFSVLIIILQLTTVAMLITYLVLKEEVPAEEAIQADIASVRKTPTNKIELLTSLRDNGTITEEEFKELLKKELEK